LYFVTFFKDLFNLRMIHVIITCLNSFFFGFCRIQLLTMITVLTIVVIGKSDFKNYNYLANKT
jgi:hypothetical protein